MENGIIYFFNCDEYEKDYVLNLSQKQCERLFLKDDDNVMKAKLVSLEDMINEGNDMFTELWVRVFF